MVLPEDLDIRGSLCLVAAVVGNCGSHRRRVWRRHSGQRPDPLRVAGGHHPGQMPPQSWPTRSKPVHPRSGRRSPTYVGDEVDNGVVGDLQRPGAGRVATLIGSDHAVAGVAQGRQLVAPTRGTSGENHAAGSRGARPPDRPPGPRRCTRWPRCRRSRCPCPRCCPARPVLPRNGPSDGEQPLRSGLGGRDWSGSLGRRSLGRRSGGGAPVGTSAAAASPRAGSATWSGVRRRVSSATVGDGPLGLVVMRGRPEERRPLGDQVGRGVRRGTPTG